MPYEPQKDKKLKSVVVCQDSGAPIEVSLNSYDGGPEKIQLRRFVVKGDQEKTLKLGRLRMEEAKEIIPALQQMVDGN